MHRRPWWLLIDRPKAAWSLLPLAVMWGIIARQAMSRGDTWALVGLGAAAGITIGGLVATLVYYRRHPEQVGRDGSASPLSRRTSVRLAVGVVLGVICAATGLVVLMIQGGPLGAVLLLLGLMLTLVCGSTLGEAARR